VLRQDESAGKLRTGGLEGPAPLRLGHDGAWPRRQTALGGARETQ
jgi:hypothetical protein